MPTKDKNSVSYFLGIDYGRSNVGLALADSETRMAFAHETLKNDKDLLQKIAELVEQKNVKQIIIGIPSYVFNKEAELEIKDFGELVEKTIKIEVFYQNEMFTTKTAHNNLIEKGVKGIKKFDDQESARIILAEWLENHQK
ncbi:MAG: Holliday junction resolvase RuvX [bacterium]|nr:Holliday junction resolvase RuvX [bacterium]